jgi:16S rRNA (guanine527-N7)-methyltransferase
MDMSKDRVGELLRPYGVSIDAHLYELIASYMSSLLQWNKKISLTAVTEPSKILKFHFGESLFAGSEINMRAGRLADVGSGAGFPGLALAMANPNLFVTLIDSNSKKAAFLSEASRKMGLKNVKIVRSRMEEFSPGPEAFDFIASRAVGQFEELLAWSTRTLSFQGKLSLWLADNDSRTISGEKGWEWLERVRIPDSEQRCLLIGKPIRP